MQKGIAGLFAAQIQKDKKTGIEPVKHPSSSPMFQVSMVERREYFEKHRCHGFNLRTVTYGDVQYSVESLLLDLEPGVAWCPDMEYFVPSVETDSSKLSKGTFRHRVCEGFDCKFCVTVPRENDFRMRVLRESQAELKRGSRICAHGVNHSSLQRAELIATIDEWKHRALDANNSAYYASLNIAALKAGKETLEEKLEKAVKELHSVLNIATLLGRAFDLGYFESRPQLLDFLTDLGRNAVSVQTHDGKSQGKRYE